MSAAASTRFALPDELHAHEPPEARGLPRDRVRLLVAGPGRVEHAQFRDLGRFLAPGDLLVVNTSATLPAAVDGVLRPTGGRAREVVVHASTALDDGRWAVELRTASGAEPLLDAHAGDTVDVAGGVVLHLLAPYVPPRAAGTRLWLAEVEGRDDLVAQLRRYGRPIRYAYVPQAWPLSAYQTVFAAAAAAAAAPARTGPDGGGSAEMPSAGRAFTPELVTSLVSAGVAVAPITLHTGVSSPDAGEPPLPERVEVPAATARLVAATRAGGGRVVAVGTTVTRALESAAGEGAAVRPARGWTRLVLGPDRPARVVDALVTGLHAPEASHLLLLEAVAGATVVQRAYDAALDHGYLWHEFGDLCLLLR